MAKIGIIGCGIVGGAVEYGFKNKRNSFRAYDKFKDSASLEEVAEFAEFIFVCLPTPHKDERIDLSIMDENVEMIAEHAKGTDKVIIIKSTVIPGTTRNYAQRFKENNFCFNPEFLTQANYRKDFVNADRIIIGADEDEISQRVSDLYRGSFPETPLFRTDLTSAEMVKYMSNCLLATKVIFANEMFEMCEKLNIQYEKVKEMVVADTRIGKTHLDITPDRGFGGKCLPKDIVAMLGLYRERGVDASLLETVWRKNLAIRKNKEWDSIPFVKSDE